MERTAPSEKGPVVIVGAGVFGASTAIRLLQKGYQVTLFDKQPYEQTKYSYLNGCDAASADMNKIIRSAYGAQTEYQELSTEALVGWKDWNAEISSGACLPDGMSRADKVFINNGNLSLTDKTELPAFEIATIENMEAAGYIDTQLITTEPRHVAVARDKGFGFAIDPFGRSARGEEFLGVLDTTGGTAVADKACRFALHKATMLGARLKFGAGVGELQSFLYDEGGHKTIVGIRTADGKSHKAEKIVLACGGWTPSLLPQLDHLCETTAGSVAMLKIPRSSSLWDRLAPENFPAYTYKVRDGAEGGIYGFPRDENGILKIGYRGTKYTNPKVQRDGKERSVPVTRYGKGEKITGIPKQAMKVIQRFLDEFLPELQEERIGIEITRLCWYTDSFDNHFVVDYVPGLPNVMVATGGSGHAFKYLPIIGKYVVDVMDGVDLDRPLIRSWRWREMQEGEESVNVLMEGSCGSRVLGNVPLVYDRDLEIRVRQRSGL